MNEQKTVKSSITEQELTEYVGKQVTVWLGRTIRNSFDTQVSISGTLEKHPENPQCRIVVNEGSYTYFLPTDVIEFGHYAAPQTFKDGSICVLRLRS